MFESASKFGEIGAGVAFGPNAQRALRLIGCGEALDKVAGPVGKDSKVWFEYRIGDAQNENEKELEGKHFATISGVDAARGNVHR